MYMVKLVDEPYFGGIAVLGRRTLGRIAESDAVEQLIALGEAQTFQIISSLGRFHEPYRSAQAAGADAH